MQLSLEEGAWREEVLGHYNGAIRIHDEASTLPSTRAVLGWAIERIRNPEASEALARLVHTAERSELAHPGIIALSSLQSQANGEPAPL
jgi:hypothetical protein